MIDIDEFLGSKGTGYTRQNSPLWEFEPQIKALLERGCTVPVIKEFLEKNGLKVSRSWLYKFISTNVKDGGKKESNHAESSANTSRSNTQGNVSPKEKTTDENNKTVPQHTTSGSIKFGININEHRSGDIEF